jgi:cobalamin biosynthesis protein CobD/CbiB
MTSESEKSANQVTDYLVGAMFFTVGLFIAMIFLFEVLSEHFLVYILIQVVILFILFAQGITLANWMRYYRVKK